MVTERDIYERFGKSIWEMTVKEIVDNGLAEVWARLVDEQDEDDCPDWYESDPEREAYGISGWSADPWDDLDRDLNDRYYLIFE